MVKAVGKVLKMQQTLKYTTPGDPTQRVYNLYQGALSEGKGLLALKRTLAQQTAQQQRDSFTDRQANSQLGGYTEEKRREFVPALLGDKFTPATAAKHMYVVAAP